jgi:lysophospholipase L1-like esterase
MLFRLVLLLVLCGVARAELTLHQNAAALTPEHAGPLVRAGNGVIWGAEAAGVRFSRDEGRSWEHRPIFDPARFQARAERALLRTREGVILYAFLNQKEYAFKWDDAKGGPQEGCRLPVYLSRSADDGRTWAAPVRLQDGWCGAVRQMIQLRTGRVLLVSQRAQANPGRHVTVVHYSDDLGASWKTGAPIDLGDDGNYRNPETGLRATTHGGGIEGTVLEKQNGELKLMLRVPHGCFYDYTSRDGVTWSGPVPSTLEASDSPGMLHRLASGRVVLVWNRFRDPVRRQGRRDQLSIAFSENDGVTWTMPQVVAAHPAADGKPEARYWISYPYVFEPSPGRLWISTMQGRLAAELEERDFLAPVTRPLDGPAVRVITLGDSITRGARRGVHPGETFSARLQSRLRAEGLPVQVHNVGIGSERTDLALDRLERDVIAQRPHVVTVMYGTNDSWVDREKTASRLTAGQYEANLRELVRRLQAARIQVVLMTAPMFAEQNPRNGLGEEPNGRLARYLALCRKVARETGTPLVDHFAGWEAEQRGGRILQPWTTDGCHPNVAGHDDLAARMVPVLAPLVRAISSPL